MPNKKLKRIKMEPGVGEQEEEEGDAEADKHAQQQQVQQQQQQQQQQQHPSLLKSQRQKIDEHGLVLLEMRSQIVSLSAHAETQAAAFRGMEQARVMGEQVVELKAAIRIKDAALQASAVSLRDKDTALQASAVSLQSKDAVIEGKNALLQSKDTIIVAKDVIIVAKDAEIQRLQAELARCGGDAAAGGGARPAPAPARAAAAAAAHAPAPAPAPAAIAVAAAAAAAAPPAPAALFPFSAEHKAPVVLLSPDRLTVTRTANRLCAWARSERGVAAGCGVVRWALQLGQENGGHVFRVGVASDAFSRYTGVWPRQSWFFQDTCMVANEEQQGDTFILPLFAAGDAVTVELKRAPGVDGLLRVRVAGKKARELRGLPRDGVLYPIVCLNNSEQRYTMVAPP